MKKIIFLFCVASNLSYGQKTLATYYDWQNTRKKEVYQVDANGEKNGLYKSYDEDGALVNEVMFKYGKKNGTWTVYTKFPNYAGKMQISSKATYVNDLKKGPAEIYRYDENIGVYENGKGNFIQEGEYSDPLQDGDWVYITPLSEISSSDQYNYIKKLPVFKGSMAVKSIVTFNRGVKILEPRNHKDQIFYYPSNKIYRNVNIDDLTKAGTDTYYYPDGKIWIKIVVENDKIVSTEQFYYSGKLQAKEIINPYSYVGYNEDGTPDANMIIQAAVNEKIKENNENIDKAITESTENANKGQLEIAINQLQYTIAYCSNPEHPNADSEHLEKARGIVEKWKKQLKEVNQKNENIEEQKNNQQKTINDLQKSIAAKYPEFERLYVEKKEIPFLVDAHGKPEYKYSHPKGKHMYEKSEQLYQEYMKLFNSEQDTNKRIAIGNDTLKLLDKLISLATGDTNELDKELKKAETSDEIKKILGL